MGWFFIAILLPLLALLVFKLFPQVSPVPLIAPFKDGQLCWGALGFSASGLYEIFSSDSRGIAITAASTGWLAAMLIVTLVFSGIVAAGGSVFPKSPTAPPGISTARHFACFFASLIAALLAATLYAVVHYSL
jgi:hypothetical protein